MHAADYGPDLTLKNKEGTDILEYYIMERSQTGRVLSPKRDGKTADRSWSPGNKTDDGMRETIWRLLYFGSALSTDKGLFY